MASHLPKDLCGENYEVIDARLNYSRSRFYGEYEELIRHNSKRKVTVRKP